MQHTHHRSRTKRTKEAKEEEKEEEGEEEKEEEEEETAHIKSNNPHLTGGEKPRENGGKTPRTVSGQGVVVCFVPFSGGVCHFWSKTKKNSTDYVGPRGSHRAIASRVLVLLCVFCFLEVFAFWSKTKKTSRKQKKQQDPTDYVGPRGSQRAIVSRVLFFFVLLLFSRSFCSFWCPLLFCGGGFVVWRCS